MAKLVKHENERYYIHYADETGRSRQLSTRTTDPKLGSERLAQFEASLSAPPPVEQQTVNLLLDAYLKDRKGRVSSYEGILFAAKRIREEFGDYQPRYISKQAVRGYIKKRRRTKHGNKPISDGTIIKELKTLRAALNLAEREDWIDKAPYIEIPNKPAPKDRWLEKEEAEKLIEAAVRPHIKLFIILALYTGARKGAILDLTWDRVSEACDLVDYARPGRPTSKKRRVKVPVPERAKAALLEARQIAKSKYVIEYNGKRLKKVQTAWDKTLIAAGIDHCCIHDMRRTCATWLVQAGVPLGKVARMLGDTEKMIEEVYGHHSPSFLMEAVDALN